MSIFGTKPFLFPFATYTDLNPIIATGKYPYGGSVPKSNLTLIEMSITHFITGANNDALNFFTINMYHRPAGAFGADVLLTTYTTNGFLALNTYMIIASAFTVTPINDGYIFFNVNMTGAPGQLYLLCPALWCR